MRIALKNFRCHESAIFTIPDAGLVLLDGPTGAGKSTILTAIVYALYGEIRRPYTHGKTTCSVSLEYKDMKIIRTSRPNRLVVTYGKKTYEDESAQGIISERLSACYDTFMASSYNQQSMNGSILSMPPSQAIALIESVAFGKENYDAIRSKIKVMVKESDTLRLRHNTEKDLLLRQLSTLEETTPSYDNGSVKNSDFDKLIVKCQRRIEKLENHKDSTLQELTQLKQKLVECRQEDKAIADKKKKIDAYSAELSQLQKIVDGITATDSELEKANNCLALQYTALQNTKNYLRIKRDESTYSDLVTAYYAEMHKKIDTIRPKFVSEKELRKLEKTAAKLEPEYEKHLIATKTYELQMSKIQDAKKRINRIAKDYSSLYGDKIKSAKLLKEKIHSEIQNIKIKNAEKYQCPKCETQLAAVDGALVVCDTQHIEDSRDIQLFLSWECIIDECMKTIKVAVKESEFDVASYQKLRKQICDGREILDQYTELNNIIVKQILSPNLQKMKIKLEDLKNSIPENFVATPEEKLDAQIQELNKLIGNLESSLKNKKTHQNHIGELTAKIEKLNTDIGGKTSMTSDIQKRIEELQNKSVELSDKHTKLLSKLVDLQSAKKYYDHMEKIKAVNNDIEAIGKSIKNAEETYAAAVKLDELNRKAEVMSVNETIQTINCNAQVYLENIFGDDISIRLVSEKSAKATKTVKMCVATHVEHRGSVYESIDQLSGGERQRCNLAFLLAINDVVGTGILILDECLNNLDSETHSKILTYLRELATDRLILVVSHEANDGLFDSIVKV